MALCVQAFITSEISGTVFCQACNTWCRFTFFCCITREDAAIGWKHTEMLLCVCLFVCVFF